MIKKAFAFVFSYKGRISRKSYLMFHAVDTLLMAIVVVIFLTTFGDTPSKDIPEWFTEWYMLIVIILAYCTIPISVKRYHDLDMGFWAFLGCSWFIPIFCQLTWARTGNISVLIIKFLWMLGTCIYLCSKHGTQGTNKYGEAPT